MKKRVAIIGAGGRDFHNFLVKYKDNKEYDVKFFTAAQIPGIEKRSFPKKLAGRLYKKNIPIFPEDDLPFLIKKYKIDQCVFSYSDISHEDVMHKASICLANGANYVLLGGEDTMIPSKKKVISICAVRTGCGKSQVSRRIATILREAGKRVIAIRHPMPYGDLTKQEVQRFTEYDDFKKHECTIEEREEYEPWVDLGIPIFAGVDYGKILKEAEKEADFIIWDGGNNDLPFFIPDMHVVVADPFRKGHESRFHPGEANIRMADVVVINKVNTAKRKDINELKENVKKLNKKAIIVLAESILDVSDKKLLKGRKALVVEDGPTLTHGGMTFGAGYLAAVTNKAKIVSPKKYAVGSIKNAYKKYDHLEYILPALGYGNKQMKELEKTINRVPADVVVDGTPVSLSKLLKINKDVVVVKYYVKEVGLNFNKVLKKKRLL